MSEDTWWTMAAVAQLETSQQQCATYCAEREKKVRDCLRDLCQFCDDGKKIQKENDAALQRLHEELGKMAAAANQQELTALLITQPDTSVASEQRVTRPKRKGNLKGTMVAPMAHDCTADLRGAVEQTRERGQRYNFARIEAWLDEIKKAVQLGNYELVRRALTGLQTDVG